MRVWVLALLATGCGGVSSSILDGGGDAAASEDAADAAAEASAITITVGSCPALSPCGGDVTGTWTLTGGCVDDPLTAAKSACPTLVVGSETATGSGTVTFAGGIVTRSYTSHYGMDITIPDACLQGATCAQAQAAYQAYIPNTTCNAVTNGCECTGSLDTTASQGSSYTTSNDEIVTGGGDHYDYCVNASGGQMQYHHVSGPTADFGSYTLTK
ncbi:MAG TPA: hypothetical protein VGH28_15905 [Polyangiaceae bacterium]|jgi:hypothetical protein